MGHPFEGPGLTARAAIAALTLVFAAGMLALAWPRTLAAVLMLPGNPSLTRIQQHKPVSAGNLESLISSRERALSWVDAGRVHTDLGLARLLGAREREGAGGQDRERLEAAIASLREGLALAPASAHAWTRLAYAELIADGPSPAVAGALGMSLRAAPFEPGLLLVRLELCLLAWPYLTTPTRELVGDQIRLAWRGAKERLVELARHSGGEDIVRAVLSEQRAELAEFEKRLRGSGD